MQGDCLAAAAVWCLVQYNQWNSSNSQRYDWRWWNHYNAWGYEIIIFFSVIVSQLPLFSQSVFCAAAERREMKRKEGKLLEAAREGDIATLSNMVWEHLCHSLPPKTHRCGAWYPEQILTYASPMMFLCLYFYQLKETRAPDIHCRDSLGNTPLHCAAYRGQKQCIIKLLKSGSNPCIKNDNGTSPTI